MKCKQCNKKIKGKVAYYNKDQVHPECYVKYKYKKQHPQPKTKPMWLNSPNYPKIKK